MTVRPWRVLPLRTGGAQTLLDEGLELFDALDDMGPTLRWYRADTSAIVLGRGQRTLRLVAGPDPVAVRASGGGAVWLSPDVLSLDVLVPAAHPWYTDQLGDLFMHVGRVWARALRGVGVDVLTVHDGPAEARRRGSAREQLAAAVCYATRGRGEVLWQGRKLVGLAQRRRRHGAMVQCGLLRRWDPAPLLSRLGADRCDDEIAGAAVGLADILPDPPADDPIMRAVLDAIVARPDARV